MIKFILYHQYLTFQVSKKGWYGNTLYKFGIKLDEDLKKFVQGRWAFQSSVSSFNIFGDDYSLNLKLSPTEFKALFNWQVENKLGKKALESLNLDTHKKYPASGEEI